MDPTLMEYYIGELEEALAGSDAERLRSSARNVINVWNEVTGR